MLSEAPACFFTVIVRSEVHSLALEIPPPRKLIVAFTLALRSTSAIPCCGLKTPLSLKSVTTHPRAVRLIKYSTCIAPVSVFLCASSVSLCVSVVEKANDHHRDTERHRGSQRYLNYLLATS